MIFVEKKDDVFVKVRCDSDIAMELSEYFTFTVPNAKFNPKFKNKMWDGKIRLFSTATRLIYAGLVTHIERFAKERGYAFECDRTALSDSSFSLVEAQQFIDALKDLSLKPRDYQLQAFAHAVRKRRALLISPTGSGKSLIIYLLSRLYRTNNKKVLIVVPTTSLVHQMASDFIDYGCSPDSIHKIYSGQDKETDASFIITTWQSIYKLHKNWFKQFNCMIGDEAHLFKATSLVSILTKLTDCQFKFGLTGTLDGSLTHKLVLEGLFGPVKQVTTTSDLIEQKHLSSFQIKAIVLSYPDRIRELTKKAKYADELNYIVTLAQRNKFISNLALSLKGNTLLLFRFTDHGKIIYDMLSQQQRKVYYVDGSVDGEDREDIRINIEGETDSIIVASLGTFSTGVNIKNLHNIIFASPSKSKIKTLQSIGRGLRLSDNKTIATLYDIVDDLSWKSKKNHTLVHFIERTKMYDAEKFDYKIYNVNLGV